MRAATEKHTVYVEISFVLCMFGFLGIAGFHRFYAGKIFTGILWLITCGFFGIGTLIDVIMILSGKFKTKNDEPLYWLFERN